MILNKLSKEIIYALNICSQVAAEQNINIYLVGGIVRDLFLDKKTQDIDICLEYDAIDFAGMLEKKHGIKVIQTQPELRTAKVKFKNDVILDLASTRQEIYPKASYLPVIKNFYCPLKDDILRRDFTVNSIAISLCKSNFGEIVDFLNGLNDLENKKLRILHENSFKDDPSRIIRAFKYAIRLGFKLENNTKTLMEKYLCDKEEDICYSRIMAEIKLVFSKNYQNTIEKFYEWNLEKLFGQNKVNVKINLLDAFQELNIQPDWFSLFSVIFLNTDKKNFENIFDKLNFENSQKKILLDYIMLLESPIFEDNFDIYNKFIGKKEASVALYYAKTGNKDAILYKKKLEKIKLEITGNDIIAMGVKPSKQFKTILSSVLKAKLDGTLKNKDDEINFIKNFLRNS